MIEIRELVIRATVESNPDNNRENRINSGRNGQDSNNNCQENVDMLLKIIKDKKER